MKIKIILPEFDDWKNSNLKLDYIFPEKEKTPKQQIEWFKGIIKEKTMADDITVVTTSSYICEAFSKIREPIKEGNNFGSKIVPTYSLGQNDIKEEESDEVFWKALADPMRDIAFGDEDFTLTK